MKFLNLFLPPIIFYLIGMINVICIQISKIIRKIIRKIIKQLKIILLWSIFAFRANNSKKNNYFLKIYYFFVKKDPNLNYYFTQSEYYLNKFPSLLIHNQIELIIFPEHNLFYFTQLLTYIGRSLEIPSIIVPFTIANSLEWSIAFNNDPLFHVKHNIYNRISAKMFPHWVNHYKGNKLIHPPGLILMHEYLKITPTNPWLINSGDIDFLAAESPAMKEYYLKAGIESSKIRITGPLYNDKLFKQIKNMNSHKNTIFKLLNLKEDKPIILCALPPDQLASRKNHVEFNSFQLIVYNFIKILSRYAKDYHIVINLHPRLSINDINYIKEYPITVADINISELISLSYVFIASCSATIRMAISCGIPVINYDLYQYHYDDYTDIPGVITLQTKKQFQEQTDKILTDKNYYQQLKQVQQDSVNSWGNPDGLAGIKLLKEIDSLLY